MRFSRFVQGASSDIYITMNLSLDLHHIFISLFVVANHECLASLTDVTDGWVGRKVGKSTS
jgi:phosphatidylglycerophosphate synthase